MSALGSHRHSSMPSFVPSLTSDLSATSSFHLQEEEGIGAADVFGMCSLMCFIPWSSFLVIRRTDTDEEDEDSVSIPEESQQERNNKVISTAKDNEEDATHKYQPVPKWKQKYIDRQSAAVSDKAPRTKRSTLEETLERCRNVESQCVVTKDDDDDDDTSTTTSTSSWASYFGLSSDSPSLYSRILGASKHSEDSVLSIGDKREKTSFVYSSISSDKSSPLKSHRRQNSPSGVMDIVD